MDINNILDSLGLDLTNPEVKRGAIEAIEAILASRHTGSISSDGMPGNSTIDVEIDPDLLQPSIKSGVDDFDEDPEINDEEKLLDKVKHNQGEDQESGEISQNSSGSNEDSSSDESTESDMEIQNSEKNNKENSDNAQADSEDEHNLENSENSESSEDTDEIDNSDEDIDEVDNSDESGDSGELSVDNEDTDEDSDNNSDLDIDTDTEFDTDDILDDEMQNTYKDVDLKAKENARRIKRERTLHAAKNALGKAIAKKANASLIRELESAIADLEKLQEAVNKKLADISDEEFNLLVNRVFDAIDALGDSDLTYSSDEERQLKAKEIKADLASNKTQTELSAEDIAQIRAETQAVKAREKELTKNQPRSRDSFKGFQDFLNSLYRAVALQVKINEVPDDSWSAINRRYSGSGVLQPGKKIQEVPDAKIPVIDFYFDCSASWDDRDIAVGQKAVDALAEMEHDGKIKVNVYYFANNVYSSSGPARNEGGTRAWNEIIKNIVVTNATNVIIMTDSDMEDWWKGPTALKHTVPGYVWYLWRNGENAPRLPRDLKGRGGTQQFSFSRGDL